MSDEPERFAVGVEFTLSAVDRDAAETAARLAMAKRRIPAGWDIQMSYCEIAEEAD